MKRYDWEFSWANSAQGRMNIINQNLIDSLYLCKCGTFKACRIDGLQAIETRILLEKMSEVDYSVWLPMWSTRRVFEVYQIRSINKKIKYSKPMLTL